MKLPIFALMGDRPVKAVATDDGGMSVLAFDWATGDFVRDLSYLERITLDPGPDGDIVSEEVFDKQLEALRRKIAKPPLSFETMVIEPASGLLDTDAVEAWLGGAEFVTNVASGKWRIHESAASASAQKAQTADESDDFPVGVSMLVEPELISLVSYAGSMSRTKEFVAWLAGKWTLRVKVDRQEFATLGNVSELFGEAVVAQTPDYDFFADIESGAITRWGGDGRQLQVHSSGPLRFHTPDRDLLARLTPEMTTAWNAAVKLVDESDPDVPKKPAEATAIILEIETNNEDDWIVVTIDRRYPPPSMRPLGEIAERWFEALIAWDGTDGIDGLTNIRHG